uniref:ATP-dependent DNA helicase n=1 Tax=Setaria italica TaxID=4555 RepID=K3Z0C7_SETIT
MRPGIFNPILYDKRLFQQFAIDTYVKIESSRLNYIRNNQDLLKADLYQGLVDNWRTRVEDADEVGKRTMLSPTFIGWPRNMRCRYMDAMALDEIKNELYPGQSPQDHPDLVTRVFRAKLEKLKRMLMEKDILGKVRAFVYVMEFQKRSLPHAHFLLIMQMKYKITCPEQYDLLISAELPNKKKYPDLYKMVTKHMMHGPCGTLNPLCQCTRGRTSCKNRYPRPSCDSTSQGHILDNQWVIPYNPCLLHTLNCHINVEACSSIKSVKYLFKYIYKGHDRASVAVREAGKKDKGNVDEITQYREARWVTPPEAMWRIYGFDLSKNHPPVQQLQLHLPDMHMVVKRPGADESMLTVYFEYNRLHEEARGILYRDFPEHYTWESNGKFWKPRKNAVYLVGRLISAHPAKGGHYFLRVLLNHVAGATSYRDLRTVDGVLLPLFREAAERRGLIEEDNTLDECLTENSLFHMPSSLRRLFTTILVFCESNDVFGLWTKHLDAILVEQMVLIDIRNMLQSTGKDIRSFPLLGIDDSYDDASGIPREIFEEASIDQNPEDVGLSNSLNEEQRATYEEIMSKVDTEQGGLFFNPSCQNKPAVATATSGVAASIMPGGRTAHSRFKIPLTLEDGSCCSFTKQSGTTKLLHQASLIIWDEASMAKRQAMEAIDNDLRDIMGRQDLPFSGNTVVFGGDFRQVLPVVRKGSKAQIVDASLRRLYLWESMRHLKLVRNMRTQSDPWFAEYLLRIGGGTEEVNGDGDVCLPDDICVPSSGDSEKDLDSLIECIFRNLNANMTNKDYITSRAILSTRNDWGEEMVYHSFGSAIDDPHNYYPSEFLNTLTPNGLPPHLLKLKIGCPVILLRNIDPAIGLCNGTRLVVRGFQRNSIDAEIVLGLHAGKRVFLPRILLCPSDDEMFPFQFKRKQIPVRLSFAMTVNKSQGQTIPNVGVYLPTPVFSH